MGGDLHAARPYWMLGEASDLLPPNKHSLAYAASLVVKTGPGLLFGFTVYNSNGSGQFIQWFDAAAVPANGTVPAGFISVATVTDRSALWIPGRSFQTGCVLCNSSTGPTL